jgi:hypothetical protein
MPRKEIDLSELGRIINEGPAGQEKIEKLTEQATTLAETLSLMIKRARPYEVPIQSDENTIRFGLIGDTQIGSAYQRLDALKAFYGRCADEGINTILHAGDVIDGWRVYRGQEFELHPNGRSWPEQRKMFADSVPRYEGMVTIFVTGNHDSSFKKLIGMVTGEELAQARPDWKFVGQDVADVILSTKQKQRFSVRLFHPGGGINQYALSYRPQRIIENIPGGQKPDLIAIGHFHKGFYIPNYRNITALCVGCFQSQTPFMAQQSIAAHVGGWIITIILGERKKLTSRVQAEWIGFFEPKEKTDGY